MSISSDLREHPRVKAALGQASALIWSWHEAQQSCTHEQSCTHDGLATLLAWWPGVDLSERIARALLDASGWDYDLAEALMDRRTRGAPHSDVYAEIDRILALPEPQRTEEWERIEKVSRA